MRYHLNCAYLKVADLMEALELLEAFCSGSCKGLLNLMEAMEFLEASCNVSSGGLLDWKVV